jgi:hypothetical protein
VKNSALIRLKNDQSDLKFEWVDFDGDDCFNDFHIEVKNASGIRRYDFGPCVVHCLRKLCKFFEDPKETTVSGGFRHPDVRRYEVHRSDDGYRLIVRFEGSGLHEQFHIQHPVLRIDAESLKQN